MLSLAACLALCAMVSSISLFIGYDWGKTRQSKLHNLILERDSWRDAAEKYRDIAKSRDINFIMPKIPPIEWRRVDKFEYISTMDSCLQKLRSTLVQVGSEKIKIDFDLSVIGSWKNWLGGNRNFLVSDRNITTAARPWNFAEKNTSSWSYLQPFRQTFIGTADEILNSVETLIKDIDWGFWVFDTTINTRRWARESSSVRFEAIIYILAEPELIKPDVKFVEVAVPEPNEDLRRRAELEVEEFLKRTTRLIP